MEFSDAQSPEMLLARAADGSQSALNRLMAHCRPWLSRRVQSRIGRELAAKVDGSDLVQECQYLAASKFVAFEGSTFGEFQAWLGGILDRRLLRAARFWRQKRRDRRREVALYPASGDPKAVAVPDDSALRRLSLDEESERMKLAASWCRDDDRAVIQLHFFDDRDYQQIAELWGVSSTVVRQRYCRAVRRLGEALELLELMTRLGIKGIQQDVIGLHRLQKADLDTIAGRLQLPRTLVKRWLDETAPLLRASAKEDPRCLK
jgi:RNA polymerase sigma factor (sigma-70 family)